MMDGVHERIEFMAVKHTFGARLQIFYSVMNSVYKCSVNYIEVSNISRQFAGNIHLWRKNRRPDDQKISALTMSFLFNNGCILFWVTNFVIPLSLGWLVKLVKWAIQAQNAYVCSSDNPCVDGCSITSMALQGGRLVAIQKLIYV